MAADESGRVSGKTAAEPRLSCMRSGEATGVRGRNRAADGGAHAVSRETLAGSG